MGPTNVALVKLFQADLQLRAAQTRLEAASKDVRVQQRRVDDLAELLQHLAHTYLGPDVKFPPMDEPPPGVVVHIAVDRLGGVGPWA